MGQFAPPGKHQGCFPASAHEADDFPVIQLESFG
jgi:hypothetical protein